MSAVSRNSSVGAPAPARFPGRSLGKDDTPCGPGSLGQQLKAEREKQHVSLEELAQTTRIPLRMLRSLENEQFEKLPGEVFVKGFLRSCARALGLPADHWADRFEAKNRSDSRAVPATITSVTAPERGRRFGVAIAVVVLLILFTLALSIVLRPRHRDNPVELSFAAPSGVISSSATFG